MDQPEWEKAKENVAPLREGRDVRTLSSALQATREQLESARVGHEAAILEARNGKGPHADDPLAPCVIFAKWAVENYPAGSPVICSAIEKPCRRFGKSKRYRDDVRLARLWVRYADMRRDKLEAYTYMHRNRIGETAALFYEAWAATLERSRDFDKAEWVYNLGREKRAQPAERLVQRQNEYYKRMAARAKRSEKKEQEKQIKNMVDVQRAEARKSRAPGRERSVVADTLLVSSATGGGSASALENAIPSTSAAKESVRPALGIITDDEARTGHRPVVHSQETRMGLRPQLSKPINNNKPEKFTVFSDKDGSKHYLDSATQNDDEMLKPMIASRADVSKEDDGQPTKWAGETLPQNPALKRRRAEAASTPPTFSVYEGGNDDSSSSQDIMVSDASRHESPRMGIHSTMTDGPDVKSLATSVDNSADELLTNHEDGRADSIARTIGTPYVSAASQSRSPTHRAVAHEDSKRPASPTINTRMAIDALNVSIENAGSLEDSVGNDSERPASPTINTKMAFEAVDGTFNDTRTMNYPLQRKSKELCKGKQISKGLPKEEVKQERFAIFSDNNSVENPPPAPGNSSKLEIFIDSAADKENAHGPRAFRSLAPGPTSTPDLEKRVLQPLPELEFRERPEDEAREAHQQPPGKGVNLEMVVIKTQPRGNEPLDKEALIKFLCQWFKSHPSCQILKEEPEEFDCMFDLESERGTLLSLDPQCIYRGSEQKSIVLLADDLNNVYGLKPAPNEADELDDIDSDTRPCIAVKVSDPENLWEFYIYRTLEERLGVEQYGASIPQALAFFEGHSKSFIILSRIGVISLADASALFGDNGISEIVCAFLLTDLLKTLELVHSAGVIHNDITLDNVLVRDSLAGFDNSNTEADGKGNIDLTREGVLLIDFNSSVDSRHPLLEGNDTLSLAKHVAGRGRGLNHSEYRAGGSTEWAFNGDCYAAAVCAAKLLKVQVSDVMGQFLKYESMWATVFNRLCSLDAFADANTTVACMRECRTLLERAIVKDGWLHRYYQDFILTTTLKRSVEA